MTTHRGCLISLDVQNLAFLRRSSGRLRYTSLALARAASSLEASIQRPA